jgi:hypothetical protein
MTPPARPDAATWAQAMYEASELAFDDDAPVTSWDAVASNPADLRFWLAVAEQALTLHAQAVAALKEEWMLYVGQPGDPTYEAMVKENTAQRYVIDNLVQEQAALKVAVAQAVAAVEQERDAALRLVRTRADYDLRCEECGAPHWMDTSIPSAIWNQIAKPEETLCLLCIDGRLAKAGLRCDAAEFYYVGTALQSKMYAESHGDVQDLERRLKHAERRVAQAVRAAVEKDRDRMVIAWENGIRHIQDAELLKIAQAVIDNLRARGPQEGTVFDPHCYECDLTLYPGGACPHKVHPLDLHGNPRPA